VAVIGGLIVIVVGVRVHGRGRARTLAERQWKEGEGKVMVDCQFENGYQDWRTGNLM